MVTAGNITGYSAVITWTTDQPSSSTVEYGTTASYGSRAFDPTLTTSHSIAVNNLNPGTTYHLRVTSTNSHNASSFSSDNTFTTVGYPIITAIIVSDVTTMSAVITWTTDQPSDSLVSYGTTTNYGSVLSDPTMTMNHSITLASLGMQTTYHFIISSRNASGIPASSADNTFTTAGPITVAITAPLTGSAVSRPDVMVQGTISNSMGSETGVTVNGVLAIVYGNEFVANHVPLAEGMNTITVNATDTAGFTASASETITATTTGNYISLTSNIDSGISALEPTLRVDGYASGTTPSISYLGPGSVDWTNCVSYDACKIKMATEGIYYFTATGTGVDGNTYQDSEAIVVFSRMAMDALLKAKWEGMRTSLLSDNIEGALDYFVEPSKDRYRQAFAAIGSAGINTRFSSIMELRFNTMYGPVAQYWVLRSETDGTFAYPVTFVQDVNGIWRLMGF